MHCLSLKKKWQQTYPGYVKGRGQNWDILSIFFAHPTEVRKIVYTTNIIDGLNWQFRKITKNKREGRIFYVTSKI